MTEAVKRFRESRFQYKRITLRPFEWEDCEALTRWGKHTDPLYEVYNRPSKMNYWYQTFYTHGKKESAARFAALNEKGALVGYLTIYHIDPAGRWGTLGINFDLNYTSQGYGTEALIGLLQLFFAHGFEEMRLDVVAFNHRAMRSYEKSGFVYDGEHWDSESERVSLDIFGDPRFEPVRYAFRKHGLRTEVLMKRMVARRAQWERWFLER